MRFWKRITALLLCLLLCGSMALGAGNSGSGDWRRTEGDGSYVTIRLAAEKDLSYLDSMYLAVRYADTKEPVALTSEYQDGYLFATVPAADADRPLEVFQAEEPVWTDLEQQYLAAQGAEKLQIRGIIQGIEAGRLNTDFLITHRGPLNRILEGYETFGQRRDGCLKWAVTPYERNKAQ